MPLYTPHGLKIRLDPDAVGEVVRPLASVHDMNDVLLDVELWENLPEGLVALSASATAAITHSPLLTIVAGILAFAIGSFVRSLTYSDPLRRAIPLFLGSWIITAVHTLAVSAYLVLQHQFVAAVVLCAINTAAHLGFLGVLDFVLAPIRVPLRRMLGLKPTHQEAVFVAICNKRAARYGLTLDWSKYTAG
jgi:hypothetical protein